MTIADLRRFINAEPFTPFTLHLTSGELVHVSSRYNIVWGDEHAKGCSVYEGSHRRWIYLSEIVAIDIVITAKY